MPPGVVTRTSQARPWCFGVIAVIVVAVTLTIVAATLPNVTAVAPVKPAPVTVTVVPPVVGPYAGLTAATTGIAPLKTKRSALTTALVPPLATTRTFTVPVPRGARAVSRTADFTFMLVAAVAPNRTFLTTLLPPTVKCLPRMVTVVPPTVDPFAGLTAVTTGLVTASAAAGDERQATTNTAMTSPVTPKPNLRTPLTVIASRCVSSRQVRAHRSST